MSRLWISHTLTLALTCGTFSLLGAGCSSSEEATDPLAMPAGPQGQTLGEMGFERAAVAEDGTPIYLSGELHSMGVRDTEAAKTVVLQQLARAYRLAPGTELSSLDSSQDQAGNRYFRFVQLHAGIPVTGSEVVVQAMADGTLMSILGQLTPEIAISTTPERTKDQALAALQTELGSGAGTLRVHEEFSLRILMHEGRPHLAYRGVVESVGPLGWNIDEVFVGAGNGDKVLARHSRIYTAIDRRVHDLAGGCLGMAALPGTLARSEGGGVHMDEAVNASYDGSGGTYWFYKHFLGRDSFDDAGARLTSTVNLKFPTGLGSCSGANAAWIDMYKQMVYGTGDAANFKNLALGFDVTAHELTHAVTARSSNLTYQNESGALNEAISDILGAGAEAWLESGGSSTGNPATISVTAKTWKIGEDVVKPGGMFPDGLRLMSNPTTDKQSRDYYPERYTGPQDNGGVHLNSGIANLAFYLLSAGGTHPRSKTSIQVDSIGIEAAVRIFYLSNNKLFTSSTNFQRARYATAQAAITLFGRCGKEWINTQRSWDAVGVLGAWTLCQSPRPGF